MHISLGFCVSNKLDSGCAFYRLSNESSLKGDVALRQNTILIADVI